MSTVEAVVYRAKNLVNGKSYIGFTTGPLRKRMCGHFSRAKVNKRSVFHAAIRRYGAENFIFGVVEEFEDKDLALMYEYELVDKERPEYNSAPGGALLRAPPGPEEVNRAYWKGKVGSRKGSSPSAQSRALMRDAKLGKPGPWAGKKRPAAAAYMKKIAEQYQRKTICVEDGRVFDSGADAARYYGLKTWEVHYSARGGYARSGRHFKFLGDA